MKHECESVPVEVCIRLAILLNYDGIEHVQPWATG